MRSDKCQFWVQGGGQGCTTWWGERQERSWEWHRAELWVKEQQCFCSWSYFQPCVGFLFVWVFFLYWSSMSFLKIRAFISHFLAHVLWRNAWKPVLDMMTFHRLRLEEFSTTDTLYSLLAARVMVFNQSPDISGMWVVVVGLFSMSWAGEVEQRQQPPRWLSGTKALSGCRVWGSVCTQPQWSCSVGLAIGPRALILQIYITHSTLYSWEAQPEWNPIKLGV